EPQRSVPIFRGAHRRRQAQPAKYETHARHARLHAALPRRDGFSHNGCRVHAFQPRVQAECAPRKRKSPAEPEPTGLRGAQNCFRLRRESRTRRGKLLQDRVLERLRCAQPDHRLGLDLDGLAGLRIAAHARLAVRLHRAADVRNHEFARATLAFLFPQLEKLLKKERGGLLRCATLFGESCHDLALAHWLGCHLFPFLLIFLSAPMRSWPSTVCDRHEPTTPFFFGKRLGPQRLSPSCYRNASKNSVKTRKNAAFAASPLENPPKMRLRRRLPTFVSSPAAPGAARNADFLRVFPAGPRAGRARRRAARFRTPPGPRRNAR